MAACTSTSYDEQESAKRASLLRCPNKQYTAPFWLKVKQLFMTKDIKKNAKCEEQKKVRRATEKSDKTYSNRTISTRKICCISLLLTLFCFSSVGFVIMWFTDIFLRQILETITVQNGSYMFESWRKPTLKPLICVYAFNYTNLEEFILLKADKLQVVETGPYCYRETLEKINVRFNDEEGTVTYGNKRTHKFDPVHSKGNPNDTLVLPNPALITAVTKVSNSKAFSIPKMLVSSALRVTNSKVILRVRAHDFFFGYDDPFLEMVTSLGRLLQMDIPFKKFGILAIRAAETDSTLTVKTGKDDLDNIDVVTAVNGEPNITIWFGDECSRIDGSDGAFFPRKDIKKSNILYLFHQDICRKLPLVYDKEVDFQDGIMAMRFHMPPWIYDTNGTCFCEDNCPPNGLFDLTLCAHGIPFLMSFPHFLHGDPSLRENIDGLHPNISLHDFYIDIQPNLGFTLGMVSRLQVNMKVVKTPGMPFLNAFKNNVVLPIVWIEVFADHMPPDLFRVIYHATFTVRGMQLCLMWGTLIAMIVTALSILYSLWTIPVREKLQSPPSTKQMPQEITIVSSQKNSNQTEQNATSITDPKETTTVIYSTRL